MRIIVGFVHFAATPVFFALAALLYLNPHFDHATMGEEMRAHMEVMGMDAGPSQLQIFSFPLPKSLSPVLPSMWLMYALMGLFHSTPWLNLFTHKRGS